MKIKPKKSTLWSLYLREENLLKLKEAIGDSESWTRVEIETRGKKISIKVNDKTIYVDVADEEDE